MPNMQERLEIAIERTETDSSLFHNMVHGTDTQTVPTEGGEVPTVAKALKDIRNELYGQTSSLVNMAQAAADDAANSVLLAQVEVQNAQVEVQNAKAEVVNAQTEVANAHAEFLNAQGEVAKAAQEVVKAKAEVTNAQTEVQNAKAEVIKAKTWAEGTDEEVEAQGGTHSCREWVDLARKATIGSFPITVTGVASANQTVLPLNLSTALSSVDQVLAVIIENTALLPENYTISADGQSVILLNPLADGERWCVKCLYDLQSMSGVIDYVVYEEM